MPLPPCKIHQYYEPRILPGKVSRMDGQPFGHLTRRDFDLPENVTLYLCMQKPFKVHPEFDHLVCDILANDPGGHAVLHRADYDHSHELFRQRLSSAGCDLSRVHFVHAQPHHRLLALYKHATLILDSYPAGDCTTTREVLELGKAIVTLPARLLGGRWTLGYFDIIGLADDAKKALIASSEEDFIDLAVALGEDESELRRVEEAIREAGPRMFHRDEAVEEWQRILLDVSPVKVCENNERMERNEINRIQVHGEL
jgi:protein O-GlcNAc transferase